MQQDLGDRAMHPLLRQLPVTGPIKLGVRANYAPNLSGVTKGTGRSADQGSELRDPGLAGPPRALQVGAPVA